MIECARCGYGNDTAGKFCAACGAPMLDARALQAAPADAAQLGQPLAYPPAFGPAPIAQAAPNWGAPLGQPAAQGWQPSPYAPPPNQVPLAQTPQPASPAYAAPAWGQPAPQPVAPAWGQAGPTAPEAAVPPSVPTTASAVIAPLEADQIPANATKTLSAFLVSFEGEPLGEFWPIHQGKAVVGRKDSGAEYDVGIDHPTTSSRHAVIYAAARPGRLKVEDLGSTNGTYVNERRIEPRERRALEHGDTLRFGGFSVRVVLV
jgi:hypothetical protein